MGYQSATVCYLLVTAVTTLLRAAFPARQQLQNSNSAHCNEASPAHDVYGILCSTPRLSSCCPAAADAQAHEGRCRVGVCDAKS
jgi:hypothetical protein